MTDETTALRRCVGSARFGIEAHEAPPEDFPVQPSQRDGLGRMCRTHWNAYTAGLARDAKARKAAAGGDIPAPPDVDGEPAPAAEAPAAEPAPARRRTRRSAAQRAGAQETTVG